MKKAICLLLGLILLLGTAMADDGAIMLSGTEKRNIKVHDTGDNTVEPGTSPTTGESLSDLAAELTLPDTWGGMVKTGEYYPMLVQISNPDGGTGNHAPWFASYADIVYETLLNGKGETRMTMLFNNVLPEYVGPLRSIRTHHLGIQAEWNCPYLFHGMQDLYVKPLIDQLNKARPQTLYSVSKKYDGLLYNGNDGYGKNWKKDDRHFRVSVDLMATPNNAGYKLAEIQKEVAPVGWEFANHAYIFTDELPQGGDDASIITVDWNFDATKEENNSQLEYDPDTNTYYRYITKDPTMPVLYDELILENPVKTKKEHYFNFDISHGNPITFTNIIVQHVTIDWDGLGTQFIPAGKKSGSGNADYFMGGKHYAGVWKRSGVLERTIFYGPDGYEMPLLRGKTLIIMMDTKKDRNVSYYP